MSGPQRYQYSFKDYEAGWPAPNGLPGKYIGGHSLWRNPFAYYVPADDDPQRMWFAGNAHYHDRRFPDQPPTPFPPDCWERYGVGPKEWGKAVEDGTFMALPSPFNYYLIDLFKERCLDGLRNLHQLRGHNLYCDCMAGQPCHGDLLIEIANRSRE